VEGEYWSNFGTVEMVHTAAMSRKDELGLKASVVCTGILVTALARTHPSPRLLRDEFERQCVQTLCELRGRGTDEELLNLIETALRRIRADVLR
jgi:hypothetical protein